MGVILQYIYYVSVQNDYRTEFAVDKPGNSCIFKEKKTLNRSITQLAKMSIDP